MSDHADTIRRRLLSDLAASDPNVIQRANAALAALETLEAENEECAKAAGRLAARVATAEDENQRLRDALQRLKSNVWKWEVPDDVREQVDAALAAVRVEDA